MSPRGGLARVVADARHGRRACAGTTVSRASVQGSAQNDRSVRPG
ncbi:hypothetical protein Y09_1564 [Brachybacterium sp. SW0106-09]|nr:hypothetical protein Y09_1564 [Brachybacterium sp. SW0106-09]